MYLPPFEALISELINGTMGVAVALILLYFDSWEFWTAYMCGAVILAYGMFTIYDGIRTYRSI